MLRRFVPAVAAIALLIPAAAACGSGDDAGSSGDAGATHRQFVAGLTAGAVK
jgi:predicted outer membrane protein